MSITITRELAPSLRHGEHVRNPQFAVDCNLADGWGDNGPGARSGCFLWSFSRIRFPTSE